MSLNLSTKIAITKDVILDPNLAHRFSKEDLDKIGKLVWDGYERDRHSRGKWEKRMEAGMDLAMQIQQDKNFPWPGCSNVIFPLITIAALQFSARSYSNIISGTDVVKCRVVGEDPLGEIKARADRISKHMSWQVLEEDTSWEEQHDRLLINLGIVGTNFVKTYFSPSKGHNVSELVMARDFVLDYYAKSVEGCTRKTHVVPLYRNEIYERVMSKVYTDVLSDTWFLQPAQTNTNSTQTAYKSDNRQGMTPPAQSDEDTPFRTLEQHRLLDLDDDGYAEPYIVTIEEKSKTVLRIVARFDSEEAVERTADGKILRIKPTEYFTKYSFIPAADGGIYDIGFGVLLGPLNEAVNSGINQLLDAGTMANSTGGFLGRGAKIRGGTYTMAPWEWKRVDSTGDDLRKSMVPFPSKEPSAVLFQLLSLLIEYTDRIAGTVDQMVGANPGQNTPAETSRNMTEQGMQVYSMIFKRVWRSMKEEFKKLYLLNETFLPSKQKFGSESDWVRREDYKANADLVVPVADPNVTSNSARFMQASAVAARAIGVPGYNVAEVEKNFLRALKVDNVDVLYPGPDKVPPLPNPKAMVENMKLEGKRMQLEHEKQKWVMALMEERRVNNAKIAKLEAEVLKITSDIGIEHAELRLQTLDMAIQAMVSHNEMIDKKLEAMKGDSDGGNDQRGGVPAVARQPGDAGLPAASAGMAGGGQGAMGVR
jgi:chaperonin GroES